MVEGNTFLIVLFSMINHSLNIRFFLMAFATMVSCTCAKQPQEDVTVLEVAGRQGVACDGTYYYVSGSTALYKYTLDGTLVLSNETPFEEITAGSPAPNHIGDIDVFEGEIYAGCEYFMDGEGTNIQTAIYDASTLKYKRSITWEPASGQVECCGLAVDRSRGLVWMADWVNGSHLYCYDLKGGDYIGKVALSPAPGLQQRNAARPVHRVRAVAGHLQLRPFVADDHARMGVAALAVDVHHLLRSRVEAQGVGVYVAPVLIPEVEQPDRLDKRMVLLQVEESVIPREVKLLNLVLSPFYGNTRPLAERKTSP